MGQANGLFSLDACVGAVHPSQGVVVERLDPQTESGDTQLQPSLDLGLSDVLRIGLQGDLAEICHGLAHGLEHPETKS